MAYGINAEVRKLGGSPSTDDVSSADIDSYIEKADSIINVTTGKSDWTTADAAYDSIELASNLYSAAMVLDYFADPEGKAKTFREEFWKLMKQITANSASTTNKETGYFVKTAGSET